MKPSAIQLELLTEESSKPVNVSSVPQRSPFRYPGGKTWLIPTARKWLAYQKPKILIEPFAGGGSISLLAASEGFADSIVMAELDPEVAAVWHTILSSDSEWLATSILDFELTSQNLVDELSVTPRSTKRRALQTILRNRTSHGGIMAPGSGVMKNGENGKGITSRWYPQTLSARIRAISEFAHKITFVECDGIELISKYDSSNSCVFIDPPYTAGGTKAGKRLYKFSQLDHDELFKISSNLLGDPLLTYNDASELHDLALKNNFVCKKVSMQNTHLNEKFELLIARDFPWIP
ncbi:MAG: DNA adenine methylase [Candidatus Planktophila sp.]|nr:DNA adenine methylase [Candidatus Planktophila sp.]